MGRFSDVAKSAVESNTAAAAAKEKARNNAESMEEAQHDLSKKFLTAAIEPIVAEANNDLDAYELVIETAINRRSSPDATMVGFIKGKDVYSILKPITFKITTSPQGAGTFTRPLSKDGGFNEEIDLVGPLDFQNHEDACKRLNEAFAALIKDFIELNNITVPKVK